MSDVEAAAVAVPDAQPRWVRVTKMGSDPHTLDWVEGITVAQAIKAANLDREKGTQLVVNGEYLDDSHLDTALEPDSSVIISSKVANG